MSWELFAVFLGSSIRLATPLLLAGIGEMVSERAGVLNMSIEGMMLTSAFAAAVGSWATGDPLLGLADRHYRGAADRAAAGRAEQHAARQPDRLRHRHQHPGAGRDHAGLSRDFRRTVARGNSRPRQDQTAAARRYPGLRHSRVRTGLAVLRRHRHHRHHGAGSALHIHRSRRSMPPAPSRRRSTSRAFR